MEADAGVTNFDLADDFDGFVADVQLGGAKRGRYRGDKNLHVRIYSGTRPDPEATKRAGYPKYKQVPYIHIVMPGSRQTDIDRPMSQLDMQRFKEQYQAWLKNEKVALVGYPLEKWSGISRAEVEELKYFNVRTVEQLAEMPDQAAQARMGVMSLKSKAQEFLEQLNGRDAQLDQAKQDIEELKAQLAALTEVKQEQTTETATTETEETPKRRGRPPKTE